MRTIVIRVLWMLFCFYTLAGSLLVHPVLGAIAVVALLLLAMAIVDCTNWFD